jgi:hypothetical protein
MAHSNNTINDPASTIATGPFHKDFSWLPDNIKLDVSARFAAQVRSMVRGCSAIAGIAHQHMLDTDNGARTLLGEDQMDSLVGMLVPVLDILNDAASNQIDYLVELAAQKKGGTK